MTNHTKPQQKVQYRGQSVRVPTLTADQQATADSVRQQWQTVKSEGHFTMQSRIVSSEQKLTCTCCHREIAVGTRIYLSKSGKAVHWHFGDCQAAPQNLGFNPNVAIPARTLPADQIPSMVSKFAALPAAPACASSDETSLPASPASAGEVSPRATEGVTPATRALPADMKLVFAVGASFCDTIPNFRAYCAAYLFDCLFGERVQSFNDMTEEDREAMVNHLKSLLLARREQTDWLRTAGDLLYGHDLFMSASGEGCFKLSNGRTGHLNKLTTDEATRFMAEITRNLDNDQLAKVNDLMEKRRERAHTSISSMTDSNGPRRFTNQRAVAEAIPAQKAEVVEVLEDVQPPETTKPAPLPRVRKDRQEAQTIEQIVASEEAELAEASKNHWHFEQEEIDAARSIAETLAQKEILALGMACYAEHISVGFSSRKGDGKFDKMVIESLIERKLITRAGEVNTYTATRLGRATNHARHDLERERIAESKASRKRNRKAVVVEVEAVGNSHTPVEGSTSDGEQAPEYGPHLPEYQVRGKLNAEILALEHKIIIATGKDRRVYSSHLNMRLGYGIRRQLHCEDIATLRNYLTILEGRAVKVASKDFVLIDYTGPLTRTTSAKTEPVALLPAICPRPDDTPASPIAITPISQRNRILVLQSGDRISDNALFARWFESALSPLCDGRKLHELLDGDVAPVLDAISAIHAQMVGPDAAKAHQKDSPLYGPEYDRITFKLCKDVSGGRTCKVRRLLPAELDALTAELTTYDTSPAFALVS